uniref:Uncharacterized protein n=1 Tax=Leptobrachium leishanense TaxID=445787 RepID=A0A8C5QUB0_9ANUR
MKEENIFHFLFLLSVMAAAELRDELTCCICTEIYKDPVTLICGHSFCRLCITRTIPCTYCESPVPKVLEYYCCEDATCICVYCSTGEHRGHQVETLNEASKKEKEKMRSILEKLTTEREEAEESVQSLQELKRQLQGKAAKVTEQITALIRDIKEQLDALENRILQEIFRQEEQVSDLIRHLEIKKDELSKNIGHIEELCNLMDPVTFLEGRESHSAEYCDAEEGYNEAEKHGTKVHDVGDLDVGMILATLHSGVAGIVSKAKRSSVQETSDMLLDVNKTSDILLDLISADNHVSVSGDLRTVSWSRFQDYPQVLSSKSFSSGRHYWEVEVSTLRGWVVGMAYPRIARRGRKSRIGENNKSWGLRMKDNNPYSMIHDGKRKTLSHHPSCNRLGIFLDYEAGRLSFYELCDPVKHLHTFTAAFTEPLHAVLSVCYYNSVVSIK